MHLRNQIRVFVVRLKNLCILGYSKCAREDSDQIAQSDLNLYWAHMSKGTFSDVAAKFIFFCVDPLSYGPLSSPGTLV